MNRFFASIVMFFKDLFENIKNIFTRNDYEIGIAADEVEEEKKEESETIIGCEVKVEEEKREEEPEADNEDEYSIAEDEIEEEKKEEAKLEEVLEENNEKIPVDAAEEDEEDLDEEDKAAEDSSDVDEVPDPEQIEDEGLVEAEAVEEKKTSKRTRKTKK